MFNFFSKAGSLIQHGVTNEITWDYRVKTQIGLRKASIQVTLKSKVQSRSAKAWKANIDVNVMRALVILPKSGSSSFESYLAGIAARSAPRVKVDENSIKGVR